MSGTNSFREKLLSASGTEQTENGEPTATKKRGRGRNKSNPETAIAKSPGHELANQQQADTSELISGLRQQEQILAAASGYQYGQNLGKIQLAGMVAGQGDVLTEAALDRIKGLQEGLKDGLENHNAVDVLDALGLVRTDEETQELREKIKTLAGADVSSFLL